MRQEEFTAGMRWVGGIAFIGIFLIYGPGLVSAPSTQSVIVGLFLGIGSIVGAAMSICGAFDKAYRDFYDMIVDAFVN